MWFNNDLDFYKSEVKAITNLYPSLIFNEINNGVILEGELEFCASFEDKEISDMYLVKIIFPDSYPNEIPCVYEIGDKIPKTYHTNPNNTLCLGTPLEQNLKFGKSPNALNYIENLLVPYLYRFSFITQHGKEPYGDYKHGAIGLIDYYMEYFEINSLQALGVFFNIILNDKYRGHSICPCGSGNSIRNCHGDKLRILLKQPKQLILDDYKPIINELEKIRKRMELENESKRIILN